MDKKEKLKYLSQWSGLQKDILSNSGYGYKNELEKIAQVSRDKYKKDFEALQKTLGGNDFQTLIKQYAEVLKPYSAEEQAKKAAESLSSSSLGLNNNLFEDILEQQKEEAKKLYESINPSLTSTIENLTKTFSDKEVLASAMESFNSLQLESMGIIGRSGASKAIEKTSTASNEDKDEEEVREPPIKITQIKIHNFRFFCGEDDRFVLKNGESMLLYGENGSGKSSLYKAFELFIKGDIGEDEFKSHTNVHKQDDPYIEFEFDNDEASIRIDDGHLKLEDSHLFVKNLSTIKPMLDYKDLLRIYFTTSKKHDSHNLFPLFKELLSEYPIVETGGVLEDLDGDGDAYFKKLKEIILDLKESMNNILRRFEFGIIIEDIKFDGHNSEIGIKIEGIPYHNDFLNEAKLSALALSILFSVILKMYSLLVDKRLKILVLDDLLLSLNMSNRHKVLELLLDKELFDDFQFFIFTHDRAFFEVAKHKFDHNQKNKWKYFELYIDDSKEFEKPFIKESNHYFEKAKELFKNKEYSECANNLRKEAEKLLVQFLPESERKKKSGGKLLLQGLIDKTRAYAKNEKNYQKLDTVLKKVDSITDYEKFYRDISTIIKETDDKKRSKERLLDILHDLEEFKNTILNPQSHHDIQAVLYKKELEDAMKLIRDFKDIIDGK